MRFLFTLILLCTYPTARAAEISICYNYDCAAQATIELDVDDRVQIDYLFNEAETPALERSAIQYAVGLMNRIAGRQTPIHNDKGGNFEDGGMEGRMDCIDHSRTTTAYLEWLEARGLLHFHRVLPPIRRAPLLVNDHWSARIVDTESAEQYAVDSWFLNNGEPAVIFPVRDWLRGAEPRG